MRPSLLLATALLFATPSVAFAQAAAQPVARTQQQVAGAGLKATFRFQAPVKAAYTCPMHPEVVSTKADTCGKCKMPLEKQTHHVAIQLADAKGQPLKGALVRLVAKDAHGMSQGLTLKGNGTYEGAFHFMPGQQQLTAHVMPAGAAKAVELKTTYQVK